MEITEYLPVFIDEGKEHLQAINKQLLKLERDPSNKTIINDIFRSVHTIKGIAATMNFSDLTKLAHQLENVLEAIRNDRVKVTINILDGLFIAANDMDAILLSIESGGNGKRDVSKTIRGLKQMEAGIDDQTFFLNKERSLARSNSASVHSNQTKYIRVKLDNLETIDNLFRKVKRSQRELNSISQELNSPALQNVVAKMEKLSEEINYALFNMRMISVETIFNRFQSMVRQIALELHKQVQLEIIDANTQIDRSIFDEICDSLIHILRNSLDHGIELPEQRIKNGKPKMGKITLKSYYRDNRLWIEVGDDGIGINKEKVIHSAITRGLITELESQFLLDSEIFDLIFVPGFTTVLEISTISGRGVGMDVVKYTIESIGGKITINSKQGLGTTFCIALPMNVNQLRKEGTGYER